VRRIAAAAAAFTSAALLVASSGAAAPIFVGPFGHGPDRVWLLLPRSRPHSIVVFLHGWKLAPPSSTHPWVRQFWPWLRHLVEHGSEIVFPAYQSGGDLQGPIRIASLRRGLDEAFQRLPRRQLPVVVAGYSYGASLGFYYAASARRWKLPQPAAVDAVFPAGPVPGARLPNLPAGVRVLLQVGDEDVVAGRSGADRFLIWLTKRRGARPRLDVVHSRVGFAAVHSAPKLASPAARRAFWVPLDMLISTVRARR
jgi:hypothetical protein